MITINKECVDNYQKYEELGRKLNTLRNHLVQINEEYKGNGIESFYESRISFMRSLYDNHKDIINKALNAEVERLKEELNKYKIE